MTPEILTAVVVAILSSKLWDFLAARFKRKDEKEDKEDKVLQAIKDLTARVDGIGTRVDENAAVLARTHILRFNDELINGVDHSFEYFRQQLQDIDTYEAYCKVHPQFRNTYATMAIDNIKDTYDRLIKKGTFAIREDNDDQ